MNAESQERLGRNEAFFRDVNERINDAAAGAAPDAPHVFLCECSNPECTERIELTAPEYEWVRASPVRFVLAPGHMAPEVEHVVERETDHIVVEKQGLAGRIARRLDPRAAEA